MPEMHLSMDLHILHADHLQKIKKGHKKLEKQDIHNTFIKTN